MILPSCRLCSNPTHFKPAACVSGLIAARAWAFFSPGTWGNPFDDSLLDCCPHCGHARRHELRFPRSITPHIYYRTTWFSCINPPCPAYALPGCIYDS